MAAAITVLVLGGVGLWVSRPDPLDPQPVTPNDLEGRSALQVAVRLYEDRGGTYVWGSNDCSVFVTEYLLNSGVDLRGRLTTQVLAGDEIARHGLVEVEDPREGDVLNYRYPAQSQPGMAGHCGVVVARGDSLWVMHNAESHGLAIQPLEGFYRTAIRVGAVDGVRVLRAKED